MKRKLIIPLLCASLLLTAGCSTPAGSSGSENSDIENTENENTDKETDSTTEDTDNTSDGDTTDASEETPDTSGTDKDSAGTDENINGTDLYSLQCTSHNVRKTTEDGSVPLLYGSYKTLDFKGESFDALSLAVADWQTKRTSELEKIISDYTDMAKEQLSSDTDFYGYSVYQSIMPTRLDNRVLSLKESYSDYSGGVHDSSYTNGINFNAVTGERLTLENVVTDYSQFSEALFTYLFEYLKSDVFKDYVFFDDYETMIRENLSTTPWYFTSTGITLIYNTYAIAPYAAGMLEISLPAETFLPYIREEYRCADTPGFASLLPGETLMLDSSAGQLNLNVTDGTSYYDGVTEDTPATLTLNGSTYTLSSTGYWLQHCYVIRQKDGRLLVMLDGDIASDDYTTRFFDITDGILRELDAADGSISMPGIDTVEINQRVNVLGTYSADMTYDISGESSPFPVDTEYVLISPFQTLQTIRELPAAKNGESVTLPAGTSLLPVATDQNTYVRVKDVSDGTEYDISITREDYLIRINGIEEFEYFMTLPYAG